MMPRFKFEPIGSSWVALHPDPRGVIFFIGGAFFGTFPTLFYRYFLECLFDSGYSVVALPFRFTFQHWSVAIVLWQEQRRLRLILRDMAQRRSYPSEIYQQSDQFFWVGHSLGCKYIALLELLSDFKGLEQSGDCLEPQQLETLQAEISQAPANIFNQRSLLIAPDISDTDSAIPQPFARLVEHLGLGVNPSRRQTLCLIKNSRLFNLTALISFAQDEIAGRLADPDETQSDLRWLLNQMAHPNQQSVPRAELPGKHLEPIGIRIGDWIVDFNPWDKFAARLADRHVEDVALKLLKKLQDR